MRRDAKGGQVCKVDNGVVEPELVRHVSRVLLTAKRGRFPLLATVSGRQTIGAIHSSLTAQPLNSFPVTVNLDWVTHSQCSSTLFFFFRLAVRSMRPLFTIYSDSLSRISCTRYDFLFLELRPCLVSRS